jgi:uncharacterized protein
MESIVNNNKILNVSIYEFAISVVVMFFAFLACLMFSVFIDTNKAYEALCIVITYISGIIYLHKKHHIEFIKRQYKPLLIKYTVIGLSIGIIILSISYAKYIYFQEQDQVSIAINTKNNLNNYELIIYLVSSCIIIPISEELLFRYYAFSIFKAKYGLILGVIISNALFAGVHYFNPDLLAIIIQGLLYTYVYIKSKSILSSIILHSINNSIWSFISYICPK